jgi:hypothetical protein
MEILQRQTVVFPLEKLARPSRAQHRLLRLLSFSFHFTVHNFGDEIKVKRNAIITPSLFQPNVPKTDR